MSPRSRLQMLHCTIFNRGIPLVCHQIDSNDQYINTVAGLGEIVKNVHISPIEQKITIPVENFQVHILAERGIIYLCVTERTDSHHLPFTFLNRVRDAFSEQPSLVSRSYHAGEDEFDRDFGPVLITVMDEFNSGRCDQLSEIEAKIEDVKRVMLDNVEKALDRGERLDDLLSKTENLESQGQEFRRRTHAVHVQARCQHLKLWLMIVASLAIFLCVILLYATGVIHS